jgi:uncharacterized protein (TIGR03083 family)
MRRGRLMQELEPVLVLDLFPEERRELLDLLLGLSGAEWNRTTVCPGWTVKDIGLHVLGDDFNLLAGARDRFHDPSFRACGDFGAWSEFVSYLNARNESWVQAARRLSAPLLCELLEFSGARTQAHFRSLDLFAMGGPVSWAGPQPAPVWFDVAREYTERWVHQQQIRDAVGRPGLKEKRYFAPVLDTFVRALPHTFRAVEAPSGTTLHLRIEGDSGGDWSLLRGDGHWTLHRGAANRPDSFVAIDQEDAWRLFTEGLDRTAVERRMSFEGNRAQGLKVLNTVSIIA